MVRIWHNYNDLREYSKCKVHKVNSNLCTWYYRDKNKFCGNYVSRRGAYGHRFNRRCWRHKGHPSDRPSILPPVVLLMISSSERTFNRDVWVEFIARCQEENVPLHLLIYHQDMAKCTVRNPLNLVSRFRPFPDLFGKILPLRNAHGGINFAQICLRMLEYGCRVPHASRCIVLTERTIPIRNPKKIYRRALKSKCHIDISYNVGFGPLPPGLPRGPRNKPYAGVNNLCQGLFTTEFLKLALPTLPLQCEKFGISLNDGVYTITNGEVFESWRAYTGSNPSEFWLVNSYLLSNNNITMAELKKHMEPCPESDIYTVAEIPEWREGWKRTYVFKDMDRAVVLPWVSNRTRRYYNGIDFHNAVSLKYIVRFIKIHKKRALFFRQVELP